MNESAETELGAVERAVKALENLAHDEWGCYSDKCCCSGTAAWECKIGVSMETIARAVIDAAADHSHPDPT